MLPLLPNLYDTVMEIENSLEIFRNFVEDSPHAILIVNAEKHEIVSQNKFAREFFGDELHNLIREETYIRLFFSKTDVEFELTIPANNKPRIASVCVRSMSWDRVPNDYRILYINDITESKSQQEKSQLDELTGIPRRNLFFRRLEEAIALASANKGSFGLLYLDLDGFKMVNDIYGHESGDTVLQIVTKRIMSCVRGGDAIGRLGGDEFGIILLDVKSIFDMGLIAKKIIESLEKEMVIAKDKSCFISASVGVSVYPDDGQDSETLIRNADRAMYAVKHDRGKGSYAYYSDGIVDQYQKKKQIESDLQKAIKNPDQFILHFMPQFDLNKGCLSGVETLTYWHPPDGKLQLPSEFLPLVENSNLIISIEQLVFSRAGSHILQWLQSVDSILPFRLIVNISSRHFTTLESMEAINTLIENIGLQPNLVDLEISESIMSDDPKTIEKLFDFHNKQVCLTLDNYGSKATSLLSLKRFPISAVKIDRSFVRNILTEKIDRAIVKHTIRLANDIGLKTIAQGVESEAQLELLTTWGCSEAQGYFFSKPLTAEAFSRYIKESPPSIANHK